MAVMGAISITMFVGVTTLALVAKVHVTEDSCRLTGLDGNGDSHTQRTVIAQVAAAVFGGEHSIGFYYIQAATGCRRMRRSGPEAWWAQGPRGCVRSGGGG